MTIALINILCYYVKVDNLKQLLIENFLQWQNEIGEIKYQKDFAEEVLEIHEVSYNRYLNGKRQPSLKTLISFAEKTGDPRFYDLAGIPRPDPDLEGLKALWKYIPEDKRHALLEQGEAYAAQNKPDPD